MCHRKLTSIGYREGILLRETLSSDRFLTPLLVFGMVVTTDTDCFYAQVFRLSLKTRGFIVVDMGLKTPLFQIKALVFPLETSQAYLLQSMFKKARRCDRIKNKGETQ